MALTNLFLGNGICPKLIRRGRNILLLQIVELDIRFLASNNYVSGDEYSLAKQFNIKFETQLFPKNFLSKENINYRGKIPPEHFFFSFNDSANEREKLKQYLRKEENKTWIFYKEVVQFFSTQVVLLTNSMIAFLTSSFEFQSNLQTSNFRKLINPFNSPICSLSGFVFSMYKLFYLNTMPIFSIPFEYGKQQKTTSAIEHKYCLFMDYLFPEKKFQFAFNNPEGAKIFKECIPDLYSPITKEAIFFNGCYYHAHYDNCSINKTATSDTIHPFGKSFKNMNDDFFAKLHLLMKNHSEISKVTVEWECNFLKTLKTQQAKLFLTSHFKPHCLIRLKPRDAVRGAFSDVFALKWLQSYDPTEKLYCVDVNGLYSYCAISFPFMTGKYVTLIGSSLNIATSLSRMTYSVNDGFSYFMIIN